MNINLEHPVKNLVMEHNLYQQLFSNGLNITDDSIIDYINFASHQGKRVSILEAIVFLVRSINHQSVIKIVVGKKTSDDLSYIP